MFATVTANFWVTGSGFVRDVLCFVPLLLTDFLKFSAPVTSVTSVIPWAPWVPTFQASLNAPNRGAFLGVGFPQSVSEGLWVLWGPAYTFGSARLILYKIRRGSWHQKWAQTVQKYSCTLESRTFQNIISHHLSKVLAVWRTSWIWNGRGTIPMATSSFPFLRFSTCRYVQVKPISASGDMRWKLPNEA